MSLYRHLVDSAVAHVLKGYKNGNKGICVIDRGTLKMLKWAIRRFADWVPQSGYRQREIYSDHDKARACLQAYQVYLSQVYRKKNGQPLSAATVHTMLAFPCTALGVSLAEIRKDKRLHRIHSKGVHGVRAQNRRGDLQASALKNRRLVEFQKRVGLRRAELADLTVDTLIKDESGYPCVEVRRGKGGKRQLQRVLPHDLDCVKDVYASAHGNTVFSKEELCNQIDLHGIRAAHARECYRYYEKRLLEEPGYREQLRAELIARYDACNSPGSMSRRKKFLHEIENQYPIYLRKTRENYRLAIEYGRPTKYDRLAVMAVSVFHLSHWRTEVTVAHYLCG